VRALAHPLRLDLLDVLRFEGPSTATLLAERLGQSSGATSYHLRQLGRHGYIEEAPSSGRRERWWRYRERRAATGTGAEGSRAILADLLSREAHALDRFLAERLWPPQWEAASFMQSRALRLTAGELDEFRIRLEELVAMLRPADGDAPPEALQVRMLNLAFPMRAGHS
jgi:DNA-binding transcriptional ArsR family regulator